MSPSKALQELVRMLYETQCKAVDLQLEACKKEYELAFYRDRCDLLLRKQSGLR